MPAPKAGCSPRECRHAERIICAALPGGKILVVSETTNSINTDLQITLTMFNV